MKIYGISNSFMPLNRPGFSGSLELWESEMSCKQADKITDTFLFPELNGKKINSLCDLGCEKGGPTKILANKFKIPYKNILGVEYYYHCYSDFNKCEEDIVYYLNEVDTDRKFDMISLCRPDCFYRGTKAPELLDAVAKRLSDDGYFFTYGENSEMDKIMQACRDAGVKYKSKNYNWSSMCKDKPYDKYNLQAILIPKSELLKCL